MGEYAIYNGEEVKIGTCEDMYYLRAAQAPLVTPIAGSCNPNDPDVQRHLRFRFPWPDEDDTEPGAFEPFDRTLAIPDIPIPREVDHYEVHFTSRTGYSVDIPCPEATPAPHGLTVRWHGPDANRPRVQLTQQAYRGGVLAGVFRCGGCGALFWMPAEEIDAVLVSLRAEADRTEWNAAISGRTPVNDAPFWHAVADRLAAGYGLEVPAHDPT